MKIEEVRSKNDVELNFELKNMQKELFDLRFRASTESTTNPARIRTLKRACTRVITVLYERKRAAEVETESA